MPDSQNKVPRLGLLFNHDWDQLGFSRHAARHRFDEHGFDLFSFPSNAGLIGFDLGRFADRMARKGRRRGWAGVLSNHEQFGALAAALTAERLGLPGSRPEAVLAAQHKFHAREVLERVAPEANVRFAMLDAAYGDDAPDGLSYPCFVKPVKAAFSVLARALRSRAELQAHTRFGWRELWVIRHLVEPFERIARERLPGLPSAHALMVEEALPHHTPQFNLDGWVFEGRTHLLGVVDAIMYPGTQAFMRWEHPSRLSGGVQQRALDVARRFLAAVGFSHGFFNMEFFHDPVTDRLTVIEFNPRMAAQFSDLYLRVHGIDPHAMLLALAQGRDPATVSRVAPCAGAAASLVYRVFPGDELPTMPGARQVAELRRRFPDSLFFAFPRRTRDLARDFKWLGSWRYGIIHLDGRSEHELRERCLRASELLGWSAPYADRLGTRPAVPEWAGSTASAPGG